jgi:hypothetical protein
MWLISIAVILHFYNVKDISLHLFRLLYLLITKITSYKNTFLMIRLREIFIQPYHYQQKYFHNIIFHTASLLLFHQKTGSFLRRLVGKIQYILINRHKTQYLHKRIRPVLRWILNNNDLYRSNICE